MVKYFSRSAIRTNYVNKLCF